MDQVQSIDYSKPVTSVWYRAPEMLRTDGESYSETVDYWALGIVMRAILIPEEYKHFLKPQPKNDFDAANEKKLIQSQSASVSAFLSLKPQNCNDIDNILKMSLLKYEKGERRIDLFKEFLDTLSQDDN